MGPPPSPSECYVTLQYLPTVNTIGPAHEESTFRFEQHRPNAATLIVFEARLRKDEIFSLLLARKPQDPFGLTVRKDGVLLVRYSACCEHSYRRGARLGGATGVFKLVTVSGGIPCPRCYARDHTGQFEDDPDFEKMLAVMDAPVHEDSYADPPNEFFEAAVESEMSEEGPADPPSHDQDHLTRTKPRSARPKSAAIYGRPRMSDTKRSRPVSARPARQPAAAASSRASESFDEMFARLSAKDKELRGSKRRLRVQPLNSNSIYGWCSSLATFSTPGTVTARRTGSERTLRGGPEEQDATPPKVEVPSESVFQRAKRQAARETQAASLRSSLETGEAETTKSTPLLREEADSHEAFSDELEIVAKEPSRESSLDGHPEQTETLFVAPSLAEGQEIPPPEAEPVVSDHFGTVQDTALNSDSAHGGAPSGVSSADFDAAAQTRTMAPQDDSVGTGERDGKGRTSSTSHERLAVVTADPGRAVTAESPVSIDEGVSAENSANTVQLKPSAHDAAKTPPLAQATPHAHIDGDMPTAVGSSGEESAPVPVGDEIAIAGDSPRFDDHQLVPSSMEASSSSVQTSEMLEDRVASSAPDSSDATAPLQEAELPYLCQCVQNFDAHEDIDLGLLAGDIVTVTNRVDENWLVGECGGREGIFPASFVVLFGGDQFTDPDRSSPLDADASGREVPQDTTFSEVPLATEGIRLEERASITASGDFDVDDEDDDDEFVLDLDDQAADSSDYVHALQSSQLDDRAFTAPTLPKAVSPALESRSDRASTERVPAQDAIASAGNRSHAPLDDSFGDGIDLTSSTISVDVSEMLASLRAEVEEEVQRQTTMDEP